MKKSKEEKLLDINKIMEEVKHKGIVRKLDLLGRFVIPIEFRTKYGFAEGTLVTFEKINDCVICRMAINNSKGIARKIDNLGRPVVPIEYRKELNWNENDEISIYMYKDFLIFRKVVYKCVMCYKEKHLIEFNGKYICKKCIDKILQKTLL